MNKKLLFTLTFLLIGLTYSSAQTYTIGTADDTNSNTSYPTAYGDYYEGSRNQFLYTAAELTAAGASSGSIVSIGFNVTATNGAGVHEDYSIYLSNTATADLSSTTWEPKGTLSYGPTDYTPTTGINTHTLVPFAWDGTSNLLVEICAGDGSSYTNNASVDRTTGLAFNGSHTYRVDGISTVCSSTSTTSTTQTTRPVLTFTTVSCTAPSADNVAVVSNCGTTGNYSVTFDVTNMGSSSSLTVTNDGGGTNPSAITSTSTGITVSGISSGTGVVVITLTPDDDPACAITLNATIPICPPVEDICTGAIDIPVAAASCSGLTTGNNTNATDSNNDPSTPAATCTNYAGGDIWFKITVPTSGNVTISGGSSPNCCSYLWYEVYSGADCTGLTSVQCSATTGDDPSTFEMALTGRTSGETLWIRAWDSSNNDGPGDFNFCAYEPCGIVSIAAGNQTACVPATNEYTQEVIVTYVSEEGNLDVNGQTFTASGSPQTVVLTGLTADNLGVNVTASFPSAGTCTATETALFTAPAPCTVTCGIISITNGGNQICSAPNGTYSNDFIVTYANPPGSGTLNLTVDGVSTPVSITGSPQTVTVSGLPANTSVIDVMATFSAEPSCTLTASSLYTGTDCAYCAASSNDCDEGIVGVTVADINNTSTCSPYTDYFSIVGTMAIGATYPITLTNGPNTYSSDQGTVWIDWNANQDFNDAGEMITLTSPDNGDTFTGNITVPTSANIGSTAMRIRINYTDTPIACGNTTYGEVEDYTLNIIVPDDCPQAVNLNEGGVAGMATGTPINGETSEATASNGSTTTCGSGDPDDDVWFEFTTDSDGGSVTVDIVPSGSFSPVCEIFNSCGNSAGICGTTNTFISSTTANTTYYIRVFDAGTDLVGGAEERAAGGFTIAVSGSALPAEVISFTGKAMDKTNMLIWETATEENVEKFVIERSIDGISDWTNLNSMPAIGNSQELLKYELEDFAPLASAYYRLRTVDFDGQTQLSKLVQITRKSNSFGIVNIAPNPTRNTAVVTFEALNNTSISGKVMDVTGKVISNLSHNAIKGVNTLELDLSNAPSGIYFLTLNNGTSNITQRVVKN